MWKKLKFSQRYEKSEDGTKSPWYEQYEKSKEGTKSPWYESSMVRKVHKWYKTSVVRKVYGAKSLAFDLPIPQRDGRLSFPNTDNVRNNSLRQSVNLLIRYLVK